HSLFRQGLRRMLEEDELLVVVGEAANGQETLRLLESTNVDVLLLDLSMPGILTGPKTAEAALTLKPSLSIIVVTMHQDEYYLREMFEIGVQGYVLKKSTAANLRNAILAVHGGQQYVDPSLTAQVVSGFLGRPAEPKTRIDAISDRERQVCSLLALGFTNSEVGDKLCISVRTVENHRSRLMSRLGLSSRAELVRFAIDNGLLKTD
ncbi:MAG: response regulator transcription factor, partial [Lentisphaerae bacterium]|nr:response regulator transcription factor [Lentisphaerota bacterium]